MTTPMPRPLVSGSDRDATAPYRSETGWRAQFGHPRGRAGWLVGMLMARKNRDRGAWVRELLEPGAEDRILDVGCGPGVDVAALSERVRYAAGVDVSTEMVRQARKRNADAIAAGRVEIACAEAAAMPFAQASFDKVCSTNSVQFWPDIPAALREIARVLRPGGTIAVAIQPRSPGATAATTHAWEARLLAELTSAGLERVRTARDERPRVPVVCCMATTARPSAGAT